MIKLGKARIDLVLRALDDLGWEAPPVAMETVLHQSLGITNLKAAEILDSAELRTKLLSSIQAAVEERLWTECRLPGFFLNTSAPYGAEVCGLGFHLASSTNPEEAAVAKRLADHEHIRSWLRSLNPPHILEATAAGLFHAAIGNGRATRRGSDQGIDAYAETADSVMVQLPAWFKSKFETRSGFIIASCKATIRSANRPATLNPAHLRELVSAYLIQRTSGGRWSSLGIRALTPMRLLLVTTYSLSDDSWSLAAELGLEVWSIPELTVLISRFVPDAFDANGTFLPELMLGWVSTFDKDANRVLPSQASTLIVG